jgi:hypothetical protein
MSMCCFSRLAREIRSANVRHRCERDCLCARPSGVREWTKDCFNKRYTEDTPTDGAPWLEGDCTKRMVRGGIWNWSADKLRSGYRYKVYHGGRYGFRVVRTLNVQ